MEPGTAERSQYRTSKGYDSCRARTRSGSSPFSVLKELHRFSAMGTMADIPTGRYIIAPLSESVKLTGVVQGCQPSGDERRSVQ